MLTTKIRTAIAVLAGVAALSATGTGTGVASADTVKPQAQPTTTRPVTGRPQHLVFMPKPLVIR